MCMPTRTSLIENLLGAAAYAVIFALFYFCLPKLPPASTFPYTLDCPPPEFRTGSLPKSCLHQEWESQTPSRALRKSPEIRSPVFLSTP
jgi:hypothetical protein